MMKIDDHDQNVNQNVMSWFLCVQNNVSIFSSSDRQYQDFST